MASSRVGTLPSNHRPEGGQRALSSTLDRSCILHAFENSMLGRWKLTLMDPQQEQAAFNTEVGSDGPSPS